MDRSFSVNDEDPKAPVICARAAACAAPNVPFAFSGDLSGEVGRGGRAPVGGGEVGPESCLERVLVLALECVDSREAGRSVRLFEPSEIDGWGRTSFMVVVDPLEVGRPGARDRVLFNDGDFSTPAPCVCACAETGGAGNVEWSNSLNDPRWSGGKVKVGTRFSVNFCPASRSFIVDFGDAVL